MDLIFIIFFLKGLSHSPPPQTHYYLLILNIKLPRDRVLWAALNLLRGLILFVEVGRLKIYFRMFVFGKFPKKEEKVIVEFVNMGCKNCDVEFVVLFNDNGWCVSIVEIVCLQDFALKV